MLKRRGYDISTYQQFLEESYTLDMFNKYFNEVKSGQRRSELSTFIFHIIYGDTTNKDFSRNMMSFLIKNPDSKYTLVFFATSTVGGNIVSEQTELLCRIVVKLSELISDLSSIIILGENNIHDPSKLSACEKLYFVQFFLDKEISSDPTDYEWGSKVEIYTKEQTAAFFNTNNHLTPNTIPAIPIEDIVLKYLGVREGIIVKFIRKSFVPDLCDKESDFFRITYVRNHKESGKK